MEGSALLFLDGPKNRLEFSLNGVFGRTQSKFDGIYGLKTGDLHLISYRLGSSDTAGEGAFTSLFLMAQLPQIYVFEWSCEEEFYKLKAFEARGDDFSDRILQYPGLISMQRFMDQQPGAQMAWRLFSDEIDAETIKRVFKDLKLEDKFIYQVTPMTGSQHSLLDTFQTSEIKTPRETENLSFTVIPSLKDFARSHPKLATECAMDRSSIMAHVLQNVTIKSLLAELKMAFLLLTFAQNFEGFEQWLAIVELFCKSFHFASENVKFYIKFLRIIQDHLNLCPDDFFSGLLSENKLFRLVDDLFQNGPPELRIFKSFFEKKFGWVFNESGLEEGEEAPLIIEE